MGHLKGVAIAMVVSFATICITTRVSALKSIAGL